MPQKKSKKILIYIFLFLIIGTFNNKNLNKIDIPLINEITVVGLDKKSIEELSDNLNFLRVNNVFFLNKANISKIISSNNLVENFSVFKGYPSSLYVKIVKTKFLAQIKKDGNIFFLGSNGKLIKVKNTSDDIPFIFGNFKNENFFKLKIAIDGTNFNYGEIKNLFSFQSGRWDIETKSGLLIKLPRDNFKKSIELFLSLKGEDNIQKIKKIDLRQFNQVVVNG
jgi:cell division septal protein FtsQ